MLNLYSETELPIGFNFPIEHLRIVNQGLMNFDPWFIKDINWILKFRKNFMNKYPASDVIPFAIKEDSEEYACWLAGDSNQVHLIDFASSTNKVLILKSYPMYWAWFKDAINDMIEYEP